MIEGVTEKMLLPLMISKKTPKLDNEYISILEVGGAYTHKFMDLLKFIKVKTLVITDIDSVNPDNSRKACSTSTENSVTSNATLKDWIPKKNLITDLISTTDEEKFDGNSIRICYQIAESKENKYVARSLEEAIINKNIDFFKDKFNGLDENKLEIEIEVKSKFELLKKVNFDEKIDIYKLSPKSKEKSQFSFDLMTFNEKGTGLFWEVPLYIAEGLDWLAKEE